VTSSDEKVLKRVRALVETAQSYTPPADAPVVGPGPTQEERLTALKVWYDDWAATAREVVTRRSDLIRLGLAKPRKSKDKGADGSATSPATTPVAPV
jgi:hypothetical protein